MTGEPLPSLPRGAGIAVVSMTPGRTRELLEATRWADTLTPQELETLARYLHACRVEKDAVIVLEGAREAYLCLVAQGRVSIRKKGADGAERVIGTAGPGKTFGEMSLVDGEPRSASVVAEEPATLLILGGESFARLTTEVPRLAVKIVLKIAKLTSQYLRRTSGALVDYLES